MPDPCICVKATTATVLWGETRHLLTLSSHWHGGASCFSFRVLSDLWLNSDGPLIPDAVLADGTEATQKVLSSLWGWQWCGRVLTWVSQCSVSTGHWQLWWSYPEPPPQVLLQAGNNQRVSESSSVGWMQLHHCRLKFFQLRGRQRVPLHKKPHGDNKWQWIWVVLGAVSSWSKKEQSNTVTTSPGTWWNSHHWRFSICDCTGC